MSTNYLYEQLPHLAPVSSSQANKELKLLAAELDSALQGQFSADMFSATPKIEAEYKGFPVWVAGMNHGIFGYDISVSLIVLLPRPTDYRLKLQNVVSVRHSFFVDIENLANVEPYHNMDEDLLEKVLPYALLQYLQESKIDFVITITADRVVLSMYGLYDHQVYLSLLDILIDMARALMDS